jgi:hypothetical protein
MSARLVIAACLAALAAAAAVGCGTRPLSTEAIEERYLGGGYANRMYDYGTYLYGQGRFREAHAAYLAAEQSAYTKVLRSSARSRRVYLEHLMAALAEGKTPPSPPFYLPPKPPPPPEVQQAPTSADQKPAAPGTGEPPAGTRVYPPPVAQEPGAPLQ